MEGTGSSMLSNPRMGNSDMSPLCIALDTFLSTFPTLPLWQQVGYGIWRN